MQSKIDMHNNQSVMYDRTIQDEIREQNELKRKNDELKCRLSQQNPQMANQFQTSHRQNEVQHECEKKKSWAFELSAQDLL